MYRNANSTRKASIKNKYNSRKTPIPEKSLKRSSLNFRDKITEFSNRFDKIDANYRESSEGFADNELKIYVSNKSNIRKSPGIILPARNVTDKLINQYWFNGYHTSVLTSKKSQERVANSKHVSTKKSIENGKFPSQNGKISNASKRKNHSGNESDVNQNNFGSNSQGKWT